MIPLEIIDGCRRFAKELGWNEINVESVHPKKDTLRGANIYYLHSASEDPGFQMNPDPIGQWTRWKATVKATSAGIRNTGWITIDITEDSTFAIDKLDDYEKLLGFANFFDSDWIREFLTTNPDLAVATK
jgi:hypothetical protein